MGTTKRRRITVASEGMGSWSRPLIDYVLRLAFAGIEIEWTNDVVRPDLLVRSGFLSLEEPRPSSCWNINQPYVIWSGEPPPAPEPRPEGEGRLVCTILPWSSAWSSGARAPIFHVPYAAFASPRAGPSAAPGVREYSQSGAARRPFSVAYCFKRPVAIREKLLQRLQAHPILGKRGVHVLGKVGGGWDSRALIQRYAQYRFVIAMENQQLAGYVTEKILNAFRAGAVPIYWGDAAYAKQLFNERAFVAVSDFPTLDDCVAFIAALDQDEARLRRMAVDEPVFRDNRVPDILTMGHLAGPAAPIYANLAATITAALR